MRFLKFHDFSRFFMTVRTLVCVCELVSERVSVCACVREGEGGCYECVCVSEREREGV